MQIFALPQQLVIPLFQRPYVWDEEDQWSPLWQDVRRVAELRLSGQAPNASHFLGAVVVQAQDAQLGSITASNVIDGQQRLTTLQLLMDATAAVLEELGHMALSGQLGTLTHNQTVFSDGDGSALKIRHTNRDQAAFDEVMSADAPVDYGTLRHAGSKIVRAHQFFSGEVASWLAPLGDTEQEAAARALVGALTSGLQLVAINLTSAENSQEIFETLNARGTPLTAADLIKNFVFQRLDAEGADSRKAYATDWPFDQKYWETEVSVGRYLVSRSSLFFNQWLVAKTGESIGPQSTFTRFKWWVEHDAAAPMSAILKEVKLHADLYEKWTRAAEDPTRQLTRPELCVYRMAANETEVLKPLLIWLHAPERALSQDVIDAVVSVCESWVMRRLMLRLPSSDLGRVVADLLRAHSDARDADIVERFTAHLSRLNVSSTYWPGDDEVRAVLATEAAYRRFKRGRLRMVLEAIEDRYRAQTGQPQLPRLGYPIEHVLPQKWQDHWPVATAEEELDRASHVHRLGNLTLLLPKLNTKVSNHAWAQKRLELRKHDTLLLNSRLLEAVGERSWDEAAIDERTAVLVEEILRTWPVPPGHTGEVIDPQAKTSEWVELKDLIRAGLLEPGTVLRPAQESFKTVEAVVTPQGGILLDGQVFETPSGAGRHVRGRATNGWTWWLLPDRRRLSDLRALHTGAREAARNGFDWSGMHAILARMPAGYWTSYGELAAAVGTSPQPLGQHITQCRECVNSHRVLKYDGSMARGFSWADPGDTRDPRAVLEEEGIVFTDGLADRARILTAETLRSFT